MPTMPPLPRRQRRRSSADGYAVDPQDRRQEQAGYPHPPASNEQARIEDTMLYRDRRKIDRSPDLNQPVPRAGMADYDRDREMKNSFAKSMMSRSPLANLQAFLNRRMKKQKR